MTVHETLIYQILCIISQMNDLSRIEYQRKYRKEHPEAMAKAARRSKIRRIEKYGIEKERERQRAYSKKNWLKNKERKVNYRRDQKLKWVQLLGGKCEICGYDKCVAAMDFHNKELKGSTNKNHTAEHLSKDFANQLQLGNIQLLCCRCHRELHNHS